MNSAWQKSDEATNSATGACHDFCNATSFKSLKLWVILDRVPTHHPIRIAPRWNRQSLQRFSAPVATESAGDFRKLANYPGN